MGPRIWSLSGHDYILSNDSGARAEQKESVDWALYTGPDPFNPIQKFYETLTMQLVRQNSVKLGQFYQVDAVRIVGNASHANFIGYLFKICILDSSYGSGGYTDLELYDLWASLFAYVFVDIDPPKSPELKVTAADAAERLGRVVRPVCQSVIAKDFDMLAEQRELTGRGPAADLLDFNIFYFLDTLAAWRKDVDEMTWIVVFTAAVAVATQAQGFAQMLDLYLSDPYKSHWPAIQELAASDTFEAFEQLKRYALEAYRLTTPAFSLTRIADADTTIGDGGRSIPVKKGDRIFVDLATAGLDPTVFPDPQAVDLTRPLEKYIHHGWGLHSCLGRPIIETAMAAQLRVFAQLKNLRRAPGVAGQLKKKTVDGPFTVYMKHDWSDWWPFPACKSNCTEPRPRR